MSVETHIWDAWQPTEYFLNRMEMRKVPQQEIMATLRTPDERRLSGSRTVYQKRFGRKLLRVVAEGDILITVYKTSRMDKYIEGR